MEQTPNETYFNRQIYDDVDEAIGKRRKEESKTSPHSRGTNYYLSGEDRDLKDASYVIRQEEKKAKSRTKENEAKSIYEYEEGEYTRNDAYWRDLGTSKGIKGDEALFDYFNKTASPQQKKLYLETLGSSKLFPILNPTQVKQGTGLANEFWQEMSDNNLKAASDFAMDYSAEEEYYKNNPTEQTDLMGKIAGVRAKADKFAAFAYGAADGFFIDDGISIAESVTGKDFGTKNFIAAEENNAGIYATGEVVATIVAYGAVEL